MNCSTCGGPVEEGLSRPNWRRCRACRAAYYRDYAKRRPESIEKRKAWRAANIEKVRAYARKWERKARAEGRKFLYDSRDASLMRSAVRFAIFDRDSGVCWLCDGLADRDNFHLDHVIPVSRGGPTTLENLRVSHPRCNQSKGSRQIVSPTRSEG